ncbi:MAG: filamentous hemagglutinin N-terminal domain-containing protein [Opitutaceae bacterium]|nr:filamentous hemagglutinin N-terminal domain-containing protein [Opitutaceae bacterium]
MRPLRLSSLLSRIRAEHLCRELLQLAFALAVVVMLAGQTAALGNDIFRRAPASGSSGATATGSRDTAAAPVDSTIDTAGLLQRRAVEALNRTDTAIRAVNAAQQAARAAAAAAASSVPDGWATGGKPGGLQPLDLSAMDKWKGAAVPTTPNGAKPNEVVIVQDDQNALLTWKTFNIGKDTTLTFDQSKGGANAGQWIAFNHVQDPSAKPSQILGKLQTIGAGAADAQGKKPVGGQVFVINPNGILFGGASQVNVHALVASTLPINQNLVAQGLLANSGDEFLFSAAELDRKGRGAVERVYGDVTVEKGAQLVAPTNQDRNGGRISLFGANVTNEGTISTPDGQTILAAGLQIGLQAHNSNDPQVRGLDVFVGGVVPGAGTVTNSGLIEVHRGNATMTGRMVDQLGVIDSTTSVSYNGSVVLNASYAARSNYNESNSLSAAASSEPLFVATRTGTVTFGADSVTRIRPEWESTEKVVGTELALASKMDVRGLNIHLTGKAEVWAPSAELLFDAGRWYVEPNSTARTVKPLFVYEDAPGGESAGRAGGQIYLDAGAVVDVSGTTAVQASVSDNVIKVELRGSEFANSPVQRDGELRGETVQVDLREHGDWDASLNGGKGGYKWIGTPLADVQGYVNLVQRSIGELTTKGGSVTMNAGGALVLQPGASVDVSGGFTTFAAGEVRTTKIIEGNRIIDISKATPERKYDGIYLVTTTTTDPKWGTTKTSGGSVSESFLEAGYTEGAAGGSLTITASGMALDGALRGQTVVGERQRSQAPKAGGLKLTFKSQFMRGDLVSATPYWHSTLAPDITFRGTRTLPAVAEFKLMEDQDGHARALSAQRGAALELAPQLFGAEGFGSLSIDNTQGNTTLPAGTNLLGTAGGELTLAGANIVLGGSIRAPGGSLTFKAYNYSSLDDLWINDIEYRIENVFTPAPNRGVVSLGVGSKLDTAGLLVDDRTETGLASPLATKGGTVALEGYSVELAAGSGVDVSGGVVRSPTGKFTYGSGGAIRLAGGQDLGATNVLGGHLDLAGELSGYSGTVGGQLSLKAPSIQVGGTTARPTTLVFQPGFFQQGGFGAFKLEGLGEWTETRYQFVPGLLVVPGTAIDARQRSRFAIAGADSLMWAEPAVQSERALRNPVNLTFAATEHPKLGADFDARTDKLGLRVRGDLIVGAGTSITTDPKGSVSFSGNTVAINEGVAVTAPGGRISVKGGGGFQLVVRRRANGGR